ncbi:hypothetical protein E1301_Tti013327 [Triplophysa tibetana]|uniref:Uncharacterized protein n=1 Tax=Triplophysa tibetana TaxID=1572043 RepID=A0A5A9MZV8_9TELE|nr:hypothetical protein E1301_Tti013327 [Triplophysa tibetana]
MAGLCSAVPGEEGERRDRVTHHEEGWLGVHQPCARRCALQETFLGAVTSTLLPPTNCSHVTPENEQTFAEVLLLFGLCKRFMFALQITLVFASKPTDATANRMCISQSECVWSSRTGKTLH